MTTVPWNDDLLEWHETFRYRDPAGVVHRVIVAMIGGPEGNTRWKVCPSSSSEEREHVPDDTTLTCIACISRGPVAEDSCDKT